jgi:hypothetical protein
MKNLIARTLLVILAVLPLGAVAGESLKDTRIVALDFQLQDMTDLPNAPAELKRIEYLSKAFKEKLADKGFELIPPSEKLQTVLTENNAAYLFDRPEVAAQLAQESGADYLVLGLALKPTYLFVYPRIKLIDLKTQEPVLSGYVQLESSAQDENTTTHSAAQLASKIAKFLQEKTEAGR